MINFGGIDKLAADYHGRAGQPGLAYGIVIGGELAHAGGLGERHLGGPAPDAGTVFRIASMTKSFTASAVLLLRDEGALALDDLAESYVPELRGWVPATPDAARVSIRHLLTMTAGFPTDDPWGDRQQGLPDDEFAAFLAGGVRFSWAPGTRFEYSNMGYAILGRVITAVSGLPYPAFIRDRLLAPLGMTRSGFEAAEFAPAELAQGYRRGLAGWEEVPFDPCGAFAPMGGVFTCVRDLARWVAGFAAAFPPGEEDAHPVRRASRREMQLPQAPTGWEQPAVFPSRLGGTVYGFGLAMEDHPSLGRVAGHGGGYPGFGSYMRWHPATGVGVIALANSTYASPSPLTATILSAVVDQLADDGNPAGNGAAYHGVALAPAGGPWPATVTAMEQVNSLLRAWDDAAADLLFAPNVALDCPYAERRQALTLIRDRIGAFAADPSRPAEHETPAHARWRLAGERGTVQVQVQLTPENPPRVQSLAVSIPPAQGSALQCALDAVLAALNEQAAPPAAADGFDAARFSRHLRAAAAWAGRCTPAACTAGNGLTTVTVELTGEHAILALTVTVQPVTGLLRHASLTWLTRPTPTRPRKSRHRRE